MIAVKDKFPKLTPEEYFMWEEQQLLLELFLSLKVSESPIRIVRQFVEANRTPWQVEKEF